MSLGYDDELLLLIKFLDNQVFSKWPPDTGVAEFAINLVGSCIISTKQELHCDWRILLQGMLRIINCSISVLQRLSANGIGYQILEYGTEQFKKSKFEEYIMYHMHSSRAKTVNEPYDVQ